MYNHIMAIEFILGTAHFDKNNFPDCRVLALSVRSFAA
jgi:hypothetical protein